MNYKLFIVLLIIILFLFKVINDVYLNKYCNNFSGQVEAGTNLELDKMASCQDKFFCKIGGNNLTQETDSEGKIYRIREYSCIKKY